jgi:hypothetical protein
VNGVAQMFSKAIVSAVRAIGSILSVRFFFFASDYFGVFCGDW